MTQGLSIRYLLIVTTLVLALPRGVDAQCVVYKVVVDGEVYSPSKAAQVLVRVHANRGKKTSETLGTLEDDHFHITVGFDTFVSVHLFGAHNCSRRPTVIDVILLEDGVAKQTINLSLKGDFRLDEKLDEWHTKVPVTLGKPTSR